MCRPVQDVRLEQENRQELTKKPVCCPITLEHWSLDDFIRRSLSCLQSLLSVSQII